MNIIVIVAHPDDEVLGAGGTIARHAKEGDIVSILFLGDGVSSRYKEITPEVESLIKERKNSAKKAANILGVQKTIFYELPDNSFDKGPILHIIRLIETTIEECDPEIVYTHHFGDLNIDHRITSEAVMVASRPIGQYKIQRILQFEVLSSSEWQAPTLKNAFLPNIFISIENTYSKKIEALKMYDKEMREFPHPRSVEAIESLAKWRGVQSGGRFAEAFWLAREIK